MPFYTRDKRWIRAALAAQNGPGATKAPKTKPSTPVRQNGAERLPASADLVRLGWQREYDGRMWLRWRNPDGRVTPFFEDEHDAADAARGME